MVNGINAYHLKLGPSTVNLLSRLYPMKGYHCFFGQKSPDAYLSSDFEDLYQDCSLPGTLSNIVMDDLGLICTLFKEGRDPNWGECLPSISKTET